MIKKLLSAILTILMVFSFSACGKGKSNKPIRLDIDRPVENLDPQYVTDVTARNIIMNIFEGLVRRDGNGNLTMGIAESYTVSPDGLTYTFTLKDNLLWSDGTPLTAEDVEFGFKRMFHSQVESPFSKEFLSIKNSDKILSGELERDSLGVEAKGNTVTFRLTKKDPMFMELLADSFAVPCNEEFFEGTRARYGLDTEYIKCNGPFKIASWNGGTVKLVPNENYYDYANMDASPVNFYYGRVAEEKPTDDNKLNLFLEEEGDIYLASSGTLSEALKKGKAIEKKENRVWLLGLNMDNAYLADETVRRAMYSVLNRDEIMERKPEKYGEAEGIIPKSCRIEGMDNFRIPKKSQNPLEDIINYCKNEDIETIKGFNILYPENAGVDSCAEYIQGKWVRDLSIFVNLEALPNDKLYKKLRDDTYNIAIFYIDGVAESPESILNKFAVGNPENYIRYESPVFDDMVASGIAGESKEDKALNFQSAENYLMGSYAVIPLYSEFSCFVASPDVNGVEFGGGYILFKNAKRS